MNKPTTEERSENPNALFEQVSEEDISSISANVKEDIRRALNEGRQERNAAAAAMQPSRSRVLRVFFK